ncbi:MAG: putative membrane protein [Methylophilaceae bacterium]|jgi:uncharacterized membrane protein
MALLILGSTNEGNKILGSESPAHGFPIIRTIKPRNIIDWLKHGLADLPQAMFASLFYGLVFASAGISMNIVLFEDSWLLSSLTTDFLLLGPFLAMGLYDLRRRMERGEKPTLIPSLTAWRTNLMNVGIFAVILVVILLIWARASLVIFSFFLFSKIGFLLF